MKEIKIDIKPMMRRLNVLEKGLSTEALAGNYKSRFKGRGLEFEGFREYTPSDDASMIDWVASLRSQKMVVRDLVEERNLSVLFVVDVSNSMLISSHDKLKCEYAAELVATLTFAICEAGDNVGLAMFNDHVIKLILPMLGRVQYYKIVKDLSNPSLYGGNFDLNRVLTSLMGVSFLNKGTILFIISDFIGLKKGWERKIEIASEKFEIIAVIVRDPIDMELPEDIGQVILEDPYSRRKVLINSKEVRKKYSENAQKQINDLNRVLAKVKSSSLLLKTNEPFLFPLIRFFKAREKKCL